MDIIIRVLGLLLIGVAVVIARKDSSASSSAVVRGGRVARLFSHRVGANLAAWQWATAVILGVLGLLCIAGRMTPN
jgi:hypothetical protein